MSNPAILSVRVTQNERDTLQAAATLARTNLSDFVRRKAVEAAELSILDRRVITIPPGDWERFEAWAALPPRAVPELQRLMASTPLWVD